MQGDASGTAAKGLRFTGMFTVVVPMLLFCVAGLGCAAGNGEPPISEAATDDNLPSKALHDDNSLSAAEAELVKIFGYEEGYDRRHAAYVFSYNADTRLIPVLIKHLDDESPAARRTCAEILGHIGAVDAFDAMLAHADDKDPIVRAAAISGLGRIGDKRALTAVLRATRDSSPDVRENAFYAAAALGGDDVTSLIIPGLEDSSKGVRFTTGCALRIFCCMGVVEYRSRILSLSNSEYRLAAVDMLTDLSEEYRKLLTDDLAAHLKTEESSEIRQKILSFLQENGTEKDVPAIQPCLASDDEWEPSSAVFALVAIGGERAWDALLTALDSKQERVRIEAIEGLAKIGGEEAKKALLGLVDSKSELVRAAALKGLGELGATEAKEIMLAALDSEQKNVRAAAIEGLGYIGSPDVVDRLIAELGNLKHNDHYPESPDVPKAIVEALVRTGDPKANDVIIKAISDIRWWNRRIDLSSIVDKKSVFLPVLVAVLKGNDESMQRTALSEIAFAGNSSVLEYVLPLASSENELNREYLAHALGELGKDSRSQKALLGLITDNYREVREAAYLAIAKAGAPECIPQLMERIDKEDGRCKLYAAYAVAKLGDDRGVKILGELARNPEPMGSCVSYGESSGVCVGLMAMLSAEQVAGTLIEFLNDPHYNTRAAAAWAIGDLKIKSAGPALETLTLKDPSMTVRREARDAFIKIFAEE